MEYLRRAAFALRLAVLVVALTALTPVGYALAQKASGASAGAHARAKSASRSAACAKQHGNARRARKAARCPKAARKATASKAKAKAKVAKQPAAPAAPAAAKPGGTPTTATVPKPVATGSPAVATAIAPVRPTPTSVAPTTSGSPTVAAPIRPTVSAPTLMDASTAGSASSGTSSATIPSLPSTGASGASGVSTTPDFSLGWFPLGELGVGGRVTGLAVDPVNPNVMLVGGDMLGVGLSVDGGRTWQATSGFSSWEINAFTWDPSNAGVVWVGTLSGPYESTDGGHTWVSRRTGMPIGDYPYSAPVQKVLEDATNSQHLLAFGGNQRQFSAPGTGALNYGLVYESVDGGAHWSTIGNIGTNWNITDVVAGSSNLQTLYASVLHHGVYESTDGGHSWAAVNSGLPNAEVWALAADPSNPGVVWAALSHDATTTGGVYRPGGIYKTTDGGQSWVSDNTGIPQISGTATAATAMDSVYRAGDGTLYTADEGYADQNRYESMDGGAHWTQAGGSFPKADPAAATPYVWAASSDGGFVIGGSSDTLMASTTRGASWYDTGSTQLATGGWRGNGFSGLLGTRVAFDQAQPGDVFLTGYDSGNLLRSTDAGTTWTRPVSSYDNYDGGYDVQAGGPAGNVVYEVLGQAGAFDGLGVSTDSGQTWSVRAGGTLPARYSVGSGQGSIAIASSDGATAYAVLPDRHLYMTTDTGSTWTLVPLPSPAFAVASNPALRTTYVATAAGVEQIANQGQPMLLSSSPLNLHRLVIGPDGTVYGAGPLASGAQSGLWTNQTGAWTRLASNAQVNDVAIDPQNPRHIVYVTNDNPYHATSLATGVWVSCNAGQTFSQDNPGLPMLRILSVAFNPSIPGRVVIGTDGRGYWQTQLSPC